MATLHYSAQNFQRIPVQGLRLENLATPPSSPQPGDTYFDTVLNHARTWNGTTWEDVSATDAAALADGSIPLAKLATDPLDRANHTGTQTASTISDFDAAVQVAAAGMVSGLDWKASARALATTNINTGGPGSVGGVSLTTGDRVLLVGQTDPAENGIWTYNGTALVRADDADADALSSGAAVAVTEGTGGNSVWLLTTDDPITVGTTGLVWTQIGAGTSYTGSSPISVVGNDIQLGTVPISHGGTGATDAATARTNLGVAQKGFAADVGALTAGVGLAIPHGLGTADLVVMIRAKATGAVVLTDVVVDATNITITVATSLAASVLRVTAVAVS